MVQPPMNADKRGLKTKDVRQAGSLRPDGIRPICYLLLALILLPACRREVRRPAVERIAILRFENLGAAQATDWMGRAFSEIITAELGGAPGLYPIPAVRVHAMEAAMGSRPAAVPGISAERTAALSAGATRIVFGQYSIRGGMLEARMTVEDEITGQMTVLPAVSAPPQDVVAAASSLARQISDGAKPYATSNPLVVETHVKAFEMLSSPDMADQLEKAIAADPDFGPSYRQLAQVKLQQKDVAGAEDVLARGLARGSAIPPAERALMQLEHAGLLRDPQQRLQALTGLAAAAPHDPEVWQDLAAAEVAAHRYSEAAAAYRKATAILPEDGNLWNQLGYAAAYAGDAAGAVDAIEHYRRLAPDSPNPLDSLGDVHLIAGQLSQAQDFYTQAATRSPEFYTGLDFLKAAMAHLMTGDVSGADALAGKYFDARAAAKDPVIEYRKAQWAWISGRRTAALQRMEQLARSSEGALAAHAYAELSIWTLMLGNREGAASLASKAAAIEARAASPQVTLAQFFSQPPAPAAEWEARARKLAPNPAMGAVGTVALTDALLLSKEFPAALPLLKAMYDNGNAAVDEGLPVLLAWACVETGQFSEAANLLRSNPPLSNAGLNWSTPLYFPRIFYLRAVVAEKQGKAQEASENRRIFEALSGPVQGGGSPGK
jgi:tetratricopeptide (TPR) repeat protein